MLNIIFFLNWLNFKEYIDTWKMDNIKEFEYTELKIREFRN